MRDRASVYVFIMSEQASDQTRKQIFKDTFRRKIDFDGCRRMTSVCSGDKELVRSLVVRTALREIANDIENDASS